MMSKSAMTPSFSGRMAVMFPGVLPSMLLALDPTACKTLPPPTLSSRMATTDGSSRMTAAAADVNQGIRRAQINRQIG